MIPVEFQVPHPFDNKKKLLRFCITCYVRFKYKMNAWRLKIISTYTFITHLSIWLFLFLILFCSSFESTKSTKGASKLRRDLINSEIANLRDLLPLPSSTRQRLSQLQLMALVCVYVRKSNYFQQGKIFFIKNKVYVPIDWILLIKAIKITSNHSYQYNFSNIAFTFN